MYLTQDEGSAIRFQFQSSLPFYLLPKLIIIFLDVLTIQTCCSELIR